MIKSIEQIANELKEQGHLRSQENDEGGVLIRISEFLLQEIKALHALD